MLYLAAASPSLSPHPSSQNANAGRSPLRATSCSICQERKNMLHDTKEFYSTSRNTLLIGNHRKGSRASIKNTWGNGGTRVDSWLTSTGSRYSRDGGISSRLHVTHI